MNKIVSLFLLLATIGSGAGAQPDSITQRLDSYLRAASAMHTFNGNVLITRNGNTLLQKSYGYKNATTGALNDSNTVFQIGSITKQFTAVVMLKLEEEGKLSMHDKLSRYFPQFKYAGEITLENLLTHTSGLYNYTNDIDEEDSAITCHPVNQQLVLDIIFKHSLDFASGTEMRYSNSGYYLAGLIIEKVTGISYEQNVRDIIFTPLQMTHSLFNFRHPADTNVATGYQALNDTIQQEASGWRWDSTVTYAAGGIWSTTGDMYKWASAVAGKKIISARSWQAATTPHLQQYGYGLFVDSLFGEAVIYHGGALPGFTASLYHFPAKDITLILLSNQGWFDKSLSIISEALSAIVLGKPYRTPLAFKEKPIAEEVLKRYTGQYDFDKKHHVYITLENGQLQMEAPQGGLPKSPLSADDDSHFYLAVIGADIEFVPNSDGTIRSLVSHYRGKNEECKKVR